MQLIRDLKYKTEKGEDPNDLRYIQSKYRFVIPSDYVFVLLNYNGLTFNYPKVISIQGEFAIMFDNLLTLEWLIAELQKGREEKESYIGSFIPIGYTSSQHIILIGNCMEHLNKIFIYDVENGENIFQCDSIFIFLNEFLLDEDPFFKCK